MKREFGKKLIEEFFPRTDLTHVIDTSGAYIPGHGTPTVILFGRHRRPVHHDVRAVLGIRGEPSTPGEPAQRRVWRSIIEHLDKSGSQNEFVSVAIMPRQTFAKHPWSIGGGGATELKELLDLAASQQLQEVVDDIGIGVVTLEDEAYHLPSSAAKRYGLSAEVLVGFVVGDLIRDWVLLPPDVAIFPYSRDTLRPKSIDSATRFLWPWRTNLWNRMWFRKTQRERGLTWYEYGQLSADKFRSPLSIAFAFVATHNHFVLDRGGKVFNRSAPVIKLPGDATEDDHLALLGLLNSSTACFWMKQVFHNKGSTVDDRGARQTTVAFENFYEFTGTGLQKFPITETKPLRLAAELDRLARERQTHLPAQLIEQFPLSRTALDDHRARAAALLGHMIALQEELDWRCYTLYGITDQDLCYRGADGEPLTPPEIALGQRAFEIVMACKMAAGELHTTWFERHGSTPITELPEHWPDDYRRLVERRLALIDSDKFINLLEQPEYKRRWNLEPWDAQEKRALRGWLLDRLEGESYWQEPHLQTTRTLANRAQMDPEFMQVAECYRGHAGFDVHTLVAELVEAESVPFVPILRYKPSGLRKRAIWEHTWALQRQEDSDNADLGDIPPPPKYRSSDFLNSTFWRLRGPLDVPKERFISYPFCSREADPSLVIAWAGWDHLQQALALAAWYTEVVEHEGWPVERLKPLLLGLAELLPWLAQWHNDIDPVYNERMGDFFALFVQGQLQ
jgi:hypothetical protein